MKVRLGDVCEKGSSNIAQKDLASRNGEYPIYGAAGLIKTVDFYQQEKEYIAIVKDGAGVGRTMALPARSSVIGTMQYIIPKDNISIKFLYYVISWMKLEKYCLGAAIPHIYFKDYKNEEFNLPTKKEQLYIVGRLDKVNDLIEKRKQQLEKLDLLVKSKFIEMFGDPEINPNNWIVKGLMEIGECKNGINFGASEDGEIVKCIGVGDIKNLSVIDNNSNVSFVSLTELPSAEYLLQNEDIIFVRSNGNKNLVGRCVIVYPQGECMTFSGFCIRFRKNTNIIQAQYLLYFLKHQRIRERIIGRGANIQNLNQKILSSLMIPIPPIDLQNEFASFVKQTDKTKSRIKQSLEKFDILKKALMQKYFG